MARRPSPALVISLVALFVSLGGVSYGVATGFIDSREIKNNTVRSKDVRNNNLTGKDIKNLTGGDVLNDRLTGADVNEGTLGEVPRATGATNADNATNLANFTPVALKTATPNVAATDADARADAPKIPLFSKGQLSIYGKCFRNSADGDIFVGTYIETSAEGALFDSNNDGKDGGPAEADFLNPDTPETEREIDLTELTAAVDASIDNDAEADVYAVTPDGAAFQYFSTSGVHQGELALANGAWGAGDGCLWRGLAFG